MNNNEEKVSAIRNRAESAGEQDGDSLQMNVDAKTTETKLTKLESKVLESSTGATQAHDGKEEVKEVGGPKGLEPTRYGDWESKGRCYDF